MLGAQPEGPSALAPGAAVAQRAPAASANATTAHVFSFIPLLLTLPCAYCFLNPQPGVTHTMSRRLRAGIQGPYVLHLAGGRRDPRRRRFRVVRKLPLTSSRIIRGIVVSLL